MSLAEKNQAGTRVQ